MAILSQPAGRGPCRACSRLALCGCLSVALHAWLASITGTGGGSPRETPEPAARLTLRIDQVSSPAPPAAALPAPLSTFAATSAAPREARRPVAPALGVTHSASPALAADGGLPRADDQTYYPLQQVDVFPAPVAPLALAALENGAAPGRILVLVSIDEAGVVSDAVLIEGGSASVEAALRSVLLPARFTPALKNGRAVKSRVVLSVE
jgi:hypothetical protein